MPMTKLRLAKGETVAVRNTGGGGTIGLDNFYLKHTPYYLNGKYIGVLTENPFLREYTKQQRQGMAITIRKLRSTHGKYMALYGPENIFDIITIIKDDKESHLQTDYSILGVFPEHPDFWMFNGILTAPNGKRTQFLYRVYSASLVNAIKNTVSQRQKEIVEFNENLAFIQKPKTSYYV